MNYKNIILKIINLSIISFIFYLSFKYLINVSNELSYQKIIASISSVSLNCVIYAIGLTVLNYLVITCYDFSVASQLKLKIPKRHLSLISLITSIINNNLGLGAFLGGMLRFRFFSRMNIRLKDIGKYLIIFSWVYWVGLVFLAGLTFIFIEPNYIVNIPFTDIKIKGIFIGLLAAVLLGLFFMISFFKDILKLEWKILFPIATTKKLIILTIISTFDWLLLSWVFYFLLPVNKLSFLNFFPIFLIAQIGAVTSHLPAGVGVFDSIVIYYLKDIFGINTLISTLILYRIIYFLLPLLVAVLLFFSYEGLWVKKFLNKRS